jgi:hypothetical protein
MSTEDRKKLIRDLIDAHGRRDVARVREILSPRLTWHSGGAEKVMGRDDYLHGLEMGAKAFADQSLKIEVLIARRKAKWKGSICTSTAWCRTPSTSFMTRMWCRTI